MCAISKTEAQMSRSEYVRAMVAATAMWIALLGGLALAPERRLVATAPPPQSSDIAPAHHVGDGLRVSERSSRQ